MLETLPSQRASYAGGPLIVDVLASPGSREATPHLQRRGRRRLSETK
jgi:hypothetical protein